VFSARVFRKLGSNPYLYPEVRFSLILESVKKAKGALILDLGCGDGFLGRCLELKGNRIIYADLAISNSTKRMWRSFWKNMGDHIICDGTKLPFRDSSFDLVISTDVIEHIAQNSRPIFMKEVARSSSSEVHLTFSTFRSNSQEIVFFGKMFSILRVALHDFSFFDHDRHTTPRINDVEELVRAHGLRIIKLKPYRGLLGLFFLGFRLSVLLRFRPRFRFIRTLIYPLGIGFYLVEKHFDHGPYVAWYLHLSHVR